MTLKILWHFSFFSESVYFQLDTSSSNVALKSKMISRYLISEETYPQDLISQFWLSISHNTFRPKFRLNLDPIPREAETCLYHEKSCKPMSHDYLIYYNFCRSSSMRKPRTIDQRASSSQKSSAQSLNKRKSRGQITLQFFSSGHELPAWIERWSCTREIIIATVVQRLVGFENYSTAMPFLFY